MNDSEARNSFPRKAIEAGGWILLVTVLWGSDLLAKLQERDQLGYGKSDFLLISEQATSAIAVLIMIPFVVRWLRLFPILIDRWAAAVIGHTAGTVIFAFGHFSIMVMLRIPWYAFHGRDYVWRANFVDNLLVEYQKDIKIYLGILAVLLAYRLFRNSRTAEPDPKPDRLAVQTRDGERLLRFDEIDYLEAARNYVSVYSGGREFVIRETMANLEKRLAHGPFVRCHRSFIVNADKVREIRSVDSGHQIVLSDGSEVALGRSYKTAFTRAVTGSGDASAG